MSETTGVYIPLNTVTCSGLANEWPSIQPKGKLAMLASRQLLSSTLIIIYCLLSTTASLLVQAAWSLPVGRCGLCAMQGGLCQQAGRAPLVSTQGQSGKACLAIPAHRGGCRICILGLSCCPAPPPPPARGAAPAHQRGAPMCRSFASGDCVPCWGGLIRDALIAQPVLRHAPWARPRGARVSGAPPAQQPST